MKNTHRFRKLKSDQRGASLAYTLVIIAILMIIGTALGTFAIMSLRLSVMQHASDKAFYLSDAAMEETLTQLESKVHEAEVFALNRVNDHSTYYDELKWSDFLEKLEVETNNGTISKERSEELLSIATSYEFHKQYYFFLFDQPALSTWFSKDYALLDDKRNFVSNNTIEFNPASFKPTYFDFLKTISLDPSNQVSYENTATPTMAVTAALVNNVIQLRLESNGEYNRYNKPLRVDVSLIPPDYTQVVSSDSSNIPIHNNQITNYALAARGDIIVSGNSNQINGDIYAYGTFPEKADYRISEQGGIMLGYRNGSNITSFPMGSITSADITPSAQLQVNGNLYSHSAVKLFGKNSSLFVAEDLYANAIQYDRDSEKANIAIDRNAYLFEDVILDGTDPVLTIGKNPPFGAAPATGTGELWGLTDTNPKYDTDTFTSSLSSSIIVNTKSENPRVTVNYAFIAGLAHLDVTRTDQGVQKDYQTGESFTTINNFYFYKTPLPGFNSSLQSKFFTYTDAEANEHNLIEAINSETGNIEKSPEFKAKYFYMSSSQNPSAVSTRDRNILTIRSITRDAQDDVIGLENNFSLGVITANQKVIDAYPAIGFNGSAPKSEFMNSATFGISQRTHLAEFDSRLNILSTRNYSNNSNVDPIYGPESDTVSHLNRYVDFSIGNITNITNPEELIIINDKATRNIYINIPEESFNKLSAEEQNSAIVIKENNDRFRKINGMIISRGNVFIYNSGTEPLTYKGTIVSDQKICLIGEGQKTFTHDDYWIKLMTAKYPRIANMLYAKTGKQAFVVTNGNVLTSSANASLSIGVGDNPTSTVININQLPTGGGMIKTKTEHSFKINSWSLE